MKTKMKYILATLVSCFLFASCQDVEEPTINIPTVRTDAVTDIGMRDALVSGSVTSKSSYCQFLLSEQPDLSDVGRRLVDARCIDEEKGLYTGELRWLEANTTYYVALRATDGFSEVTGNIQSFRTASCLTIADVTLADWETGKQEPFRPAASQSNLYSQLYTTTGNSLVYDATYYLSFHRNSWCMSPAKEIGFGNETRRFYAYDPWLVGIEDVTKIHLYANKYDFVYGSSEELSESNPNAHITMNHAFAKVTFEIKKSSDSNFNLVVGKARMCNSWTKHVNAIKFDSYLNLLTGEMSEDDEYYGHTGLFINKLNLELSATDVQTVDFYVIPTSFEDNDAMLILYEKDNWSNSFESALSGTSWSAGKHYTYPVTVTPVGLQIGGVQVEE